MKKLNKYIISGVGVFALSLNFLQEGKKHHNASSWQTKASSDESLDFKKDQKDPGGGKQDDDSSLGKDSGSDKSSLDEKTLGHDEKTKKANEDEGMGLNAKNPFLDPSKNFNEVNNFRKTFMSKIWKSYLKKGFFKKWARFINMFPIVSFGDQLNRHMFKYDKTFAEWYEDSKYDKILMNVSTRSVTFKNDQNKKVTIKFWRGSSEYKEWDNLKKEEKNSSSKLKYFRKWKWNLDNRIALKKFYYDRVYNDYMNYKDGGHRYGIYLTLGDLTTKELYTNKYDLILFQKKLAAQYQVDLSPQAFFKWIKKDYHTNKKSGVLRYFWKKAIDYQFVDYSEIEKDFKTLSKEDYKKLGPEYFKGVKPKYTAGKVPKNLDLEEYNFRSQYLKSLQKDFDKYSDEYIFFLWNQVYLKENFDDVYKSTLANQPATKTLDYSFYKWHQIREKIRTSFASLPFKKIIPIILKPEEIDKVKTDFLTTFNVDDKKFANWFDHGHDPHEIFELLTKGIKDPQSDTKLFKFDLVYYKHLPLQQQKMFFYKWFKNNKSHLKRLAASNEELILMIGQNDYYLNLWEEIKTHISIFQLKTIGLSKSEVLGWYKNPQHINKVKEIFLAGKKSDDTFAKINQKIANKEFGGPDYQPLSWEQFIHITMSKVWNLKASPKDNEIVKLIKQDMEIVKIVEKNVDYDYHSKTYFYPKKVFNLFWKKNQKFIRGQNSYDYDKLRKEVTEHYQSRLKALQEDKRKYWKEINAINDLWATNSLNKYEIKELGLDEDSVAIYKQWYTKNTLQIMNLMEFQKKTYEGKQSWYKVWGKYVNAAKPKGGMSLLEQINLKKRQLAAFSDKDYRERELNKFYLEQIDLFAKYHMNIIKEMFHHKGLFSDEEIVFSTAPSHESGYTKYFRELNFDQWVSKAWQVDKIITFFKKDHPHFEFNFSQDNFGKWITSDAAKSIRLKLHKYSKLNKPQVWEYLSQILYYPQKYIEEIKGDDFTKNKDKINSWIMTKLKTSKQPWFELSKEKLGGNVPYFVDEINQVKEYVKYNKQAYQQSGQKDKDYESWLYNWSIISGDEHYNVYVKQGDGSEKLLWDANEWRNSLERKQIAFESKGNLEELKKVFSKWFKEFVKNKNHAALVKALEEFVEYQLSVWFKKFVSTNYIALFDDVKDKDGKKIDYHLIHQWPKTNILLKEFINARKYSALKSYVLSQDAKGFKEFIDGKDPAWFKDFVKSRGTVLFKSFIKSHDRPWFDQFSKDKEIFIKEFKGPLLKTLKAIYYSPHLIYDDKKGSRVEVKPVIKYWAYSDPKYSQAQVDYYQWVAGQMGTKLKELVTLKKYQLWSGKKFTSLEKYYQDVIIAWTKHSFAPFEIFLKDSKQ